MKLKNNKFINKFLHKVFYPSVKPIRNIASRIKQRYIKVQKGELALSWFEEIIGTGLLIWIMAIPFFGVLPIWWIISLGLLPWFIQTFIREIRK